MQLRTATHSDDQSIRKLWDECFPEDSNAWRDWYFQNIYKPENVVLLLEDTMPVSMAHINQYTVMMNNRPRKAYALAGVATAEGYRRRGCADILIKQSLNQMHKRNAAFSFLYPFNYDFYRPYGYEIAYSYNRIEQGAKQRAVFCIRIENSYSQEVLYKLYREFAAALNGYVIRNKDAFEVKLKEYIGDSCDIGTAYRGGLPVAYFIGRQMQDVYELEEFICTDSSKEVLEQIAREKNGTVRAKLPFSSDPGGNLPHCMGRIIHFRALFEGIECKNCDFTIKIEDEIIAANAGVWRMRACDGKLKVDRSSGAYDAAIKINELAPVATGAKEYMSAAAAMINDAMFGEAGRCPWIIEVC